MPAPLNLIGDPALQARHSLERNLKRERHVFSMVIILLILGALAGAAVTVSALLTSALNQEERITQSLGQSLFDRFQQRNIALTTASLVIELRANGVLLPQTPMHPGETCTASIPDAQAQAVLKASCDATVQLLSASGPPPPIEIVLTDGSVAYQFGLPTGTPRALRPQSPDDARKLVDLVLRRYRALGLDPALAAREKRIIWLRIPGADDGEPPHAVGASLVPSGGAIYAVVLTSVDLQAENRKSFLPSSPNFIWVTSDGAVVVIGDIPDAQARAIDAQTRALPDGRFHWIAGYGWALRRPSTIFGIGHVIRVVPLRQQIVTMRYQLLLVLSVTAALVVLLLSTFRYWNYRFLTRTYAQASRALESELLNYLLVHATPVGLCIVKKDDSSIVLANQIARTTLGIENSDTLPAALSEKFKNQGVNKESFALAEGTRIFQFPFVLERTKGESVHLKITFAPATLNREDIFFCAIADTTEHVMAEQVLREAKLATESVARAKVNFFASMSHEIRTPLASLVGNIELLKLGTLAPEQEARVMAMQVSAMGLLQVVNDVLDFSKIDVGELRIDEEWGSVTTLMKRIALSHAHLAVKQGLKFYLVLDRAIPSQLFFDPVRISQVVNNLLSNAFKFTQSGKIVMRVRWADEALQIDIADSGIGISEELKKQLFQPFTQGNSNRLAQARGTGLGLSICERLCELMKGTITVDSTVGVGTRVAVKLPLRKGDGPTAGAEWTLPATEPAVLCLASEYQEWLTSLYDPERSIVTVFSDLRQPVDHRKHDYLIATDEFNRADVLAWWGNSRNIVWLSQDGPLVPAAREDGGVDISVYSQSGIKSATEMFAPEYQRRTDTRPSEQVPSSRRDFGKLTVLIAEDNLLNRSLLRDQLTTLGANVIEAANGEEALSLLVRQQTDKPVDIVLTDIDMPVLGGCELLDAIRARAMSMPIYAVSASAYPDDINEGRQRGFTDYLTKPVPLAVLTRVLDSAAGPVASTVSAPAAAATEAALPRLPAVPAAYSAAFVEQAAFDIAGLDTVIAARSIATLRRWLHGVSGGLSMLGPSKLLQRCQELHAVLCGSEAWDDEIEHRALAIGQDLKELREAEQRNTRRGG
ncbi:response regulator [Paraburkholderia sp. MMS20-SJTR3]|uniref:histidine kinase n=1 Tax=Paraburkholderia sejongensis TaxID=2886946 RepID=A0ABS8JMA3_9BURK|nr:ATP-binding protein [Paraburkholderia sp. MMS20-SJTR3]MCC8391011.1 response regulator [Paraburkholderia sp. MMS20-SJTR3]